jgi:hypothetical protein
VKPAFAFLAAFSASACAAQPTEANLVVSPQSPALTLRVADGFTELPALHFPIENLTNVERRVFVDADAARRVERMVVVQFEHVQAGSDFRFVYPSTPPRRWGDQVYRAGAFVYDDARAAEQAPLREAARTRALLASQGYVLPRYWRAARLARVSDPDGLSEVILFYLEDADADVREASPASFDADGDLPVEGPAREALFNRLEAAVEAVAG